MPTTTTPIAIWYCPACASLVQDDEPCECVFVARGTIDANGILHTAKRVRVYAQHADSDPPMSMLHHAAARADGSAVAWVEDHGHKGWQILPPPWEPVYD